MRPDSGRITVFGQEVSSMDERDLLQLRGSIGMVFRKAHCSIRSQCATMSPTS